MKLKAYFSFKYLLLGTAFFVVCQSAFANPQKLLAKGQKMRSSKSTARVFEKQGEQRAEYMNYLPFGAGQFQQQKTWIGLGLAAGQAGSLLFYFDRLQQIKSANNDATAVFQSADLEKDSGLYEFFDSNEAFVKKTQQESQVALFSFFGLYALGVYDALYDPFQLKNKSKKKKKREILEEDLSWEEHKLSKPQAGRIQLAREIPRENKLSLGMGPMPIPNSYLSYGVILSGNF